MKPKLMSLCAECRDALRECGYDGLVHDSLSMIVCGNCGKKTLGGTYLVSKSKKERHDGKE